MCIAIMCSAVHRFKVSVTVQGQMPYKEACLVHNSLVAGINLTQLFIIMRRYAVKQELYDEVKVTVQGQM